MEWNLKGEVEGNSHVLITEFSEYMGMWLDCCILLFGADEN